MTEWWRRIDGYDLAFAHILAFGIAAARREHTAYLWCFSEVTYRKVSPRARMERLLLLEQREVEVESPVATQCTMRRSPDSRLSQPARTSSQARRLLVFPLSWTVVSLECASSALHAFRKRQPLFVSTLRVSALDPTLAVGNLVSAVVNGIGSSFMISSSRLGLKSVFSFDASMRRRQLTAQTT